MKFSKDEIDRALDAYQRAMTERAHKAMTEQIAFARECQKAHLDAIIWGKGYVMDGKRVDPSEVEQ